MSHIPQLKRTNTTISFRAVFIFGEKYLMASFNKIILMGNVTREVKIRYTPSGTAVTEVSLAINRSWFDKQSNQRKEEVTFVDVTLWGRQAEVAGEYVTVGRGIHIEGRVQLDQWTDKESGKKRSKLRVVGESMTMLPEARPQSTLADAPKPEKPCVTVTDVKPKRRRLLSSARNSDTMRSKPMYKSEHEPFGAGLLDACRTPLTIQVRSIRTVKLV
jgi:single stranded DNA-binding protein